jgi:hypothetical protein
MGANLAKRGLNMRYAQSDDQIPELDDDLVPKRTDGEPAIDPDKPGIVSGVGSSALGATDAPTDTEPQNENVTDNDGETVEG